MWRTTSKDWPKKTNQIIRTTRLFYLKFYLGFVVNSLNYTIKTETFLDSLNRIFYQITIEGCCHVSDGTIVKVLGLVPERSRHDEIFL